MTTAKNYYDALDQATDSQQNYSDEYLELVRGLNVNFTNYGLIEVVLPAAACNINSLTLHLNDASIAVRCRNLFLGPFEPSDPNDPGYQAQVGKPEGAYEVINRDGVGWTLSKEQVLKYAQRDKLAFLLYKAGSFDLTSVHVTWDGTPDKLPVLPYGEPVRAPRGAELMPQTLVDTASIGSWTVVGSLTPAVPSDAQPPYGVTEIVEVDGSNYLEMSVPVDAPLDREMIVEVNVWARYFPPIHNPATPFADGPITHDTFDMVPLDIWIGNTASPYQPAEYKQRVGLWWTQIKQRVWVTFGTNNMVVQIRGRSTPVQVAKVSVKEI